LLAELGAIDAGGRITDEGQKLRQLPLPPRLARMVVDAAAFGAALAAAEIAVLIGERGLGGDDVDLTHRLENLRRDRLPRARDARAMAARWAEVAKSQGTGREESSVGAILALAYPERIAKNRGGGTGAFLLVNGRGANVDAASPLARDAFLAVTEMTGSAAAGRILLAAPITPDEIEARFADRIVTRDEVTFDQASASLRARRQRRLGAITLGEQPMPVEANDASARILALGVARLGIERLPWSKALRQWRDRVMFLRTAEGDEWPDLSDAGLAADTDWLAALFYNKTALTELSADDFASALTARLPYPLRRRLDAEAPTHFAAPTGTQAAIDYEAEGGPKIAIRVQELFGLDRHPAIAGGKIPLVIELLSPAHRPVQTTRDLPGFWRGSYAAVRTEMRGRYPKHPWPDDPIAAPPTRRAKPRAG
jgi:ATP-dependent helicase HrpB